MLRLYQEFTATAKLKGPGEQAVASLSARVEHLTCRAVSARRIDLHAAVAVSALVLVQKQEQLTCGLEGEGIEKRARTLQSHQAVNGVSQPVHHRGPAAPEKRQAAH